MVASFDSSQDLVTKWRQGLCPIVNGIVYPSGEVRWINILERSSSGRVSFDLSLASATSLTELRAEGSLGWTQFTTLQEICDQDSGIRAYSGEAGMGGDGFVTVCSLASGDLLWLAFFECSNPFTRLEVENGQLFAETSHGNRWVFPVTAPENVSVIDSF